MDWMDEPTGSGWFDGDIAAKFSELFSTHLIPLQINTRRKNDFDVEVCTGFGLDVGFAAYWVTAGHVLDGLRDIWNELGEENCRPRLIDQAEDTDSPGVPVNLDDVKLFGTYDGVTDIGAIALPPHQYRLLTTRTRTEFFTPRIWCGRDKVEPHVYFIAGVPAEHCKATASRTSTNVKVGVRFPYVAMPVQRMTRSEVQELHPCFGESEEVFCGKVVDVEVPNVGRVESIKGMSGGPILGVSGPVKGRLIYHMYGVQSRWLPDSRIVAGTDIRVIADQVDAALHALADEQGEGGADLHA